MFKNNSQKGAVEISTIATIVIVAAVVAAVSIYATGKYYESLVITTPTTIVTPKATPSATPTPDATASWKVYNDNKIGFEIRYPAEWSDAQETNIDNDKLVTFGNDNIEFVDIRKFELQKNQLFKDVLIQKTTLGEGPNHPEFSQFKLKKIGNENFYYIFPYLSEAQYSVSYWYVKELKVIQFQLTAYTQGDWQSDSWKIEDQLSFKKFDQILSTFKFTGTDETADWKTYTNNAYKFNFKYPTEFVSANYTNYLNDFGTRDYLDRFGSVINMFALSKSAYPKNTDLSRADILIAINRDVSGGAYFFQSVDRSKGVPPPELEKLSLKKTVVLNGITWGMAKKEGAAAGTHSQTRVYHTFQNGSWYEVQLNLWTANDGNIPRVNENDIWNKLESVLPTFKFTK